MIHVGQHTLFLEVYVFHLIQIVSELLIKEMFKGFENIG